MSHFIDFTSIITKFIDDFGYFGIFFLMMLESTVLPVPSELVLIPAGYLCFAGDMNWIIVALLSTFGSLCGAGINYTISRYIGRGFLLKYGKYFLFSEDKFFKIEKLFIKYGEVSTFVGRLLPVVRHFISIPAGLYKMNIAKFALFTTIGAFLWSCILLLFGYFVGKNIELFKHYALYINLGIVAVILMFILVKVCKK